jgi:hypothetical protein
MMRTLTAFVTAIAALGLLPGCGPGEDIGEGIPWSINVPELSIRLIVKDTTIELGRYPTCVMEVMNTSQRPILLSKRFSLNGPAVFDHAGRPAPQRRPLKLTATEGTLSYRIKPGEAIAVHSKPNYRMDEKGRYTLQFSIHPEWWDFEDPENPGTMEGNAGDGREPAVSNKMTIVIY